MGVCKTLLLIIGLLVLVILSSLLVMRVVKQSEIYDLIHYY